MGILGGSSDDAKKPRPSFSVSKATVLRLSEVCRSLTGKEAVMLNSTPVIKSQVMQRISQAPAAKVWMPVDFLDLGSRDAVDKTLQRMVADNGLRRVDRGLYDQPRVNGLPAVPDYLSVIDAVGRRDQVRVQTVMIERDGSATIAADRSWSPLPTAAVGFVASPQHHQNLTPNPSRLGVFICIHDVHGWFGSPLFTSPKALECW
jgi:hypothetical protein